MVVDNLSDFLPPSTVLIASAVGTLALFAYTSNKKRSTLPFPPGPPNRIPGIGSLAYIPVHHPWETYAKWGKEYDSDVLIMRGAAMNVVILNSVEAATDLLDKRSSVYSSRPPFSILDMMGWDYLLSNMKYTSSWREHRKLFKKHLHPTKPELFERRVRVAIQERLIPQLMETPEKWVKHFRHAMGSTSISIAYGIPYDSKPGLGQKASGDATESSSPEGLIALAEEAMETLNAAPASGAVMLDVFPLLKHFPSWFPGLGFLAKLPDWQRLATEFREIPFEVGKTLFAEGKAEESFISQCFDHEEDEKVTKETAAMVFAAGVDTTLALLHNFVFAMLIHQDVQTRVQQELDQLLATENRHVPEPSDSDKLPYLAAVLKEVIRWRPALPMGAPHAPTQDDVYKGYLIPKDSVVMPNIWLMTRDERLYGPNTEEFRPERFLCSDGKLNPNVSDPSDVCFGFGRRICPGLHVAKYTLLVAATHILSSFSIKPVVDEKTGEVKELSLDWPDLVVCPPLPFECKFVPRREPGKM